MTSGPTLGRFELTELTPELIGQAAGVLAAAFLDDPAWLAIGPKRRPARERLLRRYYAILTSEALRFAGPSWCVLIDERVAGVALVYPDGRRFPPPRATLREAIPFVLGGPGPAIRAAWVDYVMKQAHPGGDHLLLWYFAARPDVQRIGIGRALMHHVEQQAALLGRPIYLDTTKPENIGYYQFYGFRQIGTKPLPRGARVWFMLNDRTASTVQDSGKSATR